MAIAIYKSLWGMTGSMRENIERISSAGYVGVEGAIVEIQDHKKFRELLREFSLQYIPLIYTEGNDISSHIDDFRRLITIASEYSPSKAIAHAGRDLWSSDDQFRFFELALKIEQEFGIPIAHETHRRRPLYSPMNTVAILKEFPELKINADLSHWCCVTESMLEDHAAVIELASQHTIHIHCRVGYENGPQVSDPRAPEWAAHLARFESWWKMMLASGNEVTVTPEYGPPSYMQTTPFENKPVADLWEICQWSADRFRAFAG
jgi:hypothetical protein